jgi:sterol-4alpha-carboxylate 3-dehydrogenase (decarboxylating)
MAGIAPTPLSIMKQQEVKELLDEIKPIIIVHAASPFPVTAPSKSIGLVNIMGLSDLIIANTSKSVRAIIYGSSLTKRKYRTIDISTNSIFL